MFVEGMKRSRTMYGHSNDGCWKAVLTMVTFGIYDRKLRVTDPPFNRWGRDTGLLWFSSSRCVSSTPHTFVGPAPGSHDKTMG
jgi:hypothetical protein